MFKYISYALSSILIIAKLSTSSFAFSIFIHLISLDSSDILKSLLLTTNLTKKQIAQ